MKRVLTFILLACLIFTTTGCDKIIFDKPVPDGPLEWNVREILGAPMEIQPFQLQMQIMDFDSTVSAVSSIFENQKYAHYNALAGRKLSDWTYSREFFEENTLLILQSSNSRFEIADVSVVQGKLKVTCNTGALSLTSDSDYCCFLEIYGYQPDFVDDIILETSDAEYITH